jgi:hypothetical protein
MATAKDLIVKPIKSADAIAFVKAHHYSGKVAQNSQLHLGVFLDGRLHGVMQFGPSLDKRKIQGLVSGTQWHEFLELNRMAFDDVLPRNSESRALSIAWRLLKKHAPQVKWVVSFADGTQCGDGTIYRAAGFVLTAIKKNYQIWIAHDSDIKVFRITETNSNKLKQEGARESRTSLTDGKSKGQQAQAQKIASHAIVNRVTESKKVVNAVSTRTGGDWNKTYGATNGAASMKAYKEAGFRPLEGFQLRYIYFINPAYRARLTVPELPYSEIKARGAKMYKGIRDTGETDNAPQSNAETGGASPTVSLSEVAIEKLQNDKKN